MCMRKTPRNRARCSGDRGADPQACVDANLHKPLTGRASNLLVRTHSRAGRCGSPEPRPSGLRQASEITGGGVFCGDSSWPAPACSRAARQRSAAPHRQLRQQGICGRTKHGRRSERSAIEWLGGEVYGYQRATWRWQRLMGVSLTPTEGASSRMSVADVQRAVAALAAACGRGPAARSASAPSGGVPLHPPLRGQLADSGGPYYGGLQMDLGFQRTYAPLAPADEGDGRPLDTARADLDGGESGSRAGVSSPGRTRRGTAACSDIDS